MQKIHQLPPHEAQKIAAGEVVERPANVIKELIENAVDAGATHISAQLENAGSDRITITDNGCGMSPDDARLCIAPYATSKIRGVDELQTIATFGFRGEALASIAAVSHMRIHTKEADAAHGVALTIQAGNIVQQEAVACNTGTSIHINDLFYNVPARKKFLKKKETEWRCIQQLFQAFCLDYPSIHFILEHDGRTAYNCPPVATLQERVTQLWDYNLAQQMIPMQAEHNQHAIRVQGIISHHQYGRYDRNAIFIFVNKRWIKNYTLTKALLKGYSHVIPTDRYPAACITIDVDPHSLDINIHPRKEEVQFMHPRVVEQLIQTGVKQALEEHLSQQLNKPVTFKPDTVFTPSTTIHTFPNTFKPSFLNQPYGSLHPQTPKTVYPAVPAEVRQADSPGERRKDASINSAVNARSEFENLINEPNPVRPACPLELAELNNLDKQNSVLLHTNGESLPFSIIGQYHSTYILLEQDNGLFMIDQHAAHERILYEQFTQRFDAVPTINLLFPEIVPLSEQEITLLEAHRDLFSRNGIIIEQFGTNQMIVQSVPVHAKTMDCKELLHTVASLIGEHQDMDAQQLFTLVNDKMHTQMACKAAIKAGDQLTMEHMRQLITDLNKTANRFSCPHGRPTGWLISLQEIEKYFKRDYR